MVEVMLNPVFPEFVLFCEWVGKLWCETIQSSVKTNELRNIMHERLQYVNYRPTRLAELRLRLMTRHSSKSYDDFQRFRLRNCQLEINQFSR